MKLSERLHEYGLFIRGIARLTDEEIETYGISADKPVLALVGNIGSSYWPVFSQSDEYRDGEAEPLDRWSERVASGIEVEFELQPVYPFTGPPYYPFQQWAHRAEALEQSPVGVMMHPEFGLWHSYRFALLGAEFTVSDAPVSRQSPCRSCDTQPCLRSCPVDAFDGQGYDVDRCARYLLETPHAECHSRGCIARHACPVAPDMRYVPEQGSFHLRAFLDARK